MTALKSPEINELCKWKQSPINGEFMWIPLQCLIVKGYQTACHLIYQSGQNRTNKATQLSPFSLEVTPADLPILGDEGEIIPFTGSTVQKMIQKEFDFCGQIAMLNKTLNVGSWLVWGYTIVSPDSKIILNLWKWWGGSLLTFIDKYHISSLTFIDDNSTLLPVIVGRMSICWKRTPEITTLLVGFQLGC